jgi:hypothetical protein
VENDWLMMGDRLWVEDLYHQVLDVAGDYEKEFGVVRGKEGYRLDGDSID